jgi:hypothetical protein
MTITDLRAVARYALSDSHLEERIKRLRSALESCTAKPLSRTPRSRSSQKDKLGDDVARLIELEERRKVQIIDLEQRLEGVEVWIDSLPPHRPG